MSTIDGDLEALRAELAQAKADLEGYKRRADVAIDAQCKASQEFERDMRAQLDEARRERDEALATADSRGGQVMALIQERDQALVDNALLTGRAEQAEAREAVLRNALERMVIQYESESDPELVGHPVRPQWLTDALAQPSTRVSALLRVVALARELNCCDGEDACQTQEMKDALAALDATNKGDPK